MCTKVRFVDLKALLKTKWACSTTMPSGGLPGLEIEHVNMRRFDNQWLLFSDHGGRVGPRSVHAQ